MALSQLSGIQNEAALPKRSHGRARYQVAELRSIQAPNSKSVIRSMTPGMLGITAGKRKGTRLISLILDNIY